MILKDEFKHVDGALVKNLTFVTPSSGDHANKRCLRITWADQDASDTDIEIGTVDGLSTSVAKNLVYAGPDGSTGHTADAVPTFRSLKAEDIPSLNTSKLTAGTLGTARGGTNKNSWTAYSIPFLSNATTFGEVTIGNAGQALVVNSDKTGYTWATFNNYSLPTASTSALGGILIGKDNSSYTVTAATSNITSNITSGKYYAVEIDKNDKAFVYVPWTNPEALKNPESLTIQLNGGTSETGTTINKYVYDGSVAKSINITPASIGAQPSGSYQAAGTYLTSIGTTTDASHTNDLKWVNSDNGSGYITVPYATIASNLSSIKLYRNASVDAYPLNTDKTYATGFSTWAFGANRNTSLGYIGILKPDSSTLSLNAHGTILTVGTGDTHMLIGIDYSGANLVVGGGNADTIKWLKKVAFTDSNITGSASKASNLTDGATQSRFGILYQSGASTTSATNPGANVTSAKYLGATTNANGAITPTWTSLDTTVTQNSSNLVTSGAVYSAIASNVAGAVQYLGTVSSSTAMTGLTTAGYGDFARVTTSFKIGDNTAHVGDIVILTSNAANGYATASNWTIAHIEIDTNTWNAASFTANGYVPKYSADNSTDSASANTYHFLGYSGTAAADTTLKWYSLPANAFNNTNTWRSIVCDSNTATGTGTGTGVLKFVSGTNISLGWVNTNNAPTITVNHGSVTCSTTAAAAANSGTALSHSGEFVVPTAMTVSSQGHVTALTWTRYKLPASGNTDNTAVFLGATADYVTNKTKKTDTTKITKASSTGLAFVGGTNKFYIGDGTNYIEVGVAHGLSTKNMNINGTDYALYTSAASLTTIYAPTSAGTSGYILTSQGSGKAPSWTDKSSISVGNADTLDNFHATKFLQTYSRENIGTSPNYDNPQITIGNDTVNVNGVFEVRSSTEVTGESGTRPFDGFGTMVCLRGSNTILEIAASTSAIKWRETQSSKPTLTNEAWKTFYHSGNFSVKLNGTTTTSAEFYAPTSLSSTGNYVLATNADKNGLEWVANPDHTYTLTVNGTTNGTSGGTSLGTLYAVATSNTTTANQVWMRNSANNGYGWRTLGSNAFDSHTIYDVTTVETNKAITLSKETWGVVHTYTTLPASGTYVIQISGGNVYASGVFSITTNDAYKEEIPLHVCGKTDTWRPWAKWDGSSIYLASSKAVTNLAVTIKIKQLI